MPVWARYEDLQVALDAEPSVGMFGPFAGLQLFLVLFALWCAYLGARSGPSFRARVMPVLVALVFCVGVVWALWLTLALALLCWVWLALRA